MNEVLDEKRDTGEWTVAQVPRRARTGGFKELEHDRVDLRVHPLDARNALLDQAGAADLASANQLGEAQSVVRVVFGKARHRAETYSSQRPKSNGVSPGRNKVRYPTVMFRSQYN